MKKQDVPLHIKYGVTLEDLQRSMDRVAPGYRSDAWLSDEEWAKKKAERAEARAELEARWAREKLERRPKLEETKKRYRTRTYGLTPDQFTAMLQAQNGRCAACKAPFGLTRALSVHIDHDHATGLVRGLLCGMCNLTLGYCHDNPKILRGLLRYLAHHAIDR